MGSDGTMSPKRRDDLLGYLIPPGSVRASDIERGLLGAMEQRRFVAGLGVPSVPTRYVVGLHPADRAWLDPCLEEDLAGRLARRAEQAGYLILGDIEVELEPDGDVAMGRPRYWAGFSGGDLMVLAGPEAALEVFART